MNNNSDAVNFLKSLGFAPADQIKDFDGVLRGVDYLFRNVGGKYQYVSLMAYEGAFCGAALEVYLAVKNTRRPKAANRDDMERKGFAPKMATLFYSIDALIAAVQEPQWLGGA